MRAGLRSFVIRGMLRLLFVLAAVAGASQAQQQYCYQQWVDASYWQSNMVWQSNMQWFDDGQGGGYYIDMGQWVDQGYWVNAGYWANYCYWVGGDFLTARGVSYTHTAGTNVWNVTFSVNGYAGDANDGVELDIGYAPATFDNCTIFWDIPSGTLGARGDDGFGQSGSLSFGGTLSNSRCSFRPNQAVVSISAGVAQITIPITLNPGFVGSLKVWEMGWSTQNFFSVEQTGAPQFPLQAYPALAQPPTAGGGQITWVSPSEARISVSATEPNGAPYLSSVFLSLNKSPTFTGLANSCTLQLFMPWPRYTVLIGGSGFVNWHAFWYAVFNNSGDIYTDGSWVQIGDGLLANSQCAISQASAPTIALSGNTITTTLNLKFPATWATSTTPLYAWTKVYDWQTTPGSWTNLPLAAPTTTSLVSSANPSLAGGSVTFTATVSPSAATGSVTFSDNNVLLGSAMLSSGAASYTTSALGAGTHSITASYGGGGSYGQSASTALTQTVKLTQTISFIPPTGIVFGQGTALLAASASSGLSVAFSIQNSATCALSLPATLVILGAGTCDVTLTQLGNAVYAPAQVTQTVSIGKAVQTISFTPGDVPITSGSVTLSASASSQLPVLFSTETSSVCTVNGTTVTLLAVGACTVVADQGGSANYTAARMPRTFNVLVAFTVASEPAGLAISVDGSAYTAPRVFQWIAGSSHTVGVLTTQSGGNGKRYMFTSWTDAGSAEHTLNAPSPGSSWGDSLVRSSSVTASFQVQYYITTTATAGGTISPAPGWFESGTTISLTAIPGAGFRFTGFAGGATGTDNPQNLIVSGAQSVTALFSDLGTPTIMTRSLSSATTLTRFSQSLAATGGSGQYSWILSPTSPSPPEWFQVLSTGIVTGTPPAGTGGTIVNFAVQAIDRNGHASQPQALTLTVHNAALSINGGGSTGAAYFGAATSLAFSYYDPNGADDLGWAQFYLSDSAGGVHCLGDWGRPTFLALYSDSRGVASALGTERTDSFCTVSLVSVSNSDDNTATAILKFTFKPGTSGTYTVLTQPNYIVGAPGSWTSVGTITISATPTVQLRNTTQSTGTHYAGDSFEILVTGLPNQTVTVSNNGNASVSVGNESGSSTSDSEGKWRWRGSWTVGNIGNWQQTWFLGGTLASPLLNYTVLARPATTLLWENLFYPGVPNFLVGGGYRLIVSGEPGVPVVLSTQQTTFYGQVISSTVAAGQIGADGAFQFQSVWGFGDQGEWVVKATVAGSDSQPVTFTVNAVSCQ